MYLVRRKMNRYEEIGPSALFVLQGGCTSNRPLTRMILIDYLMLYKAPSHPVRKTKRSYTGTRVSG